ncbi:cell division protein FtsQ [Thiogranum longum]|uniref:Cell division protein FtsQ n=1 Tax=Thiogranum longum TaxID=1537524 RepID=A0A4R1HAZ4_9GAMM|nr:cell division protein FtsQ/DivIB [Thiogranum longum]TCK17320.1 cell division protein FtsQ [Thiogranum longum]
MAAKRKLQARRRQKPARKPLSFWLRPVFVVLVVSSSVAGLALMLEWMKDPSAWPVQNVQIEGDLNHLDADVLQSFLEPMTKQGFFSVQVGEIQSQLQARPWVEQVSVRRVWPDLVQVHIREQQPVVRWGETGFLNPRGEYFSPQAHVEIAGLPWLAGPDGYEKRVLSMFAQMRKSLRPLQLEVVRLQLDARRAWHVTLNNGLKMELGRRDPLQRVARFIRAYPEIMAAGSGRVVSVDLRYSNGVAVRWQSMNKQAKSTG